ncbi:MAG: AAA family ATPase, partial [Planctomycetota bacterium]|nr:AAA family ATPase [Planctomycetota bacterium]
VLDAPYGPPGVPTGLVLQARAQGARTVVEGRDLLRAQAAGQARLFAAGQLSAADTERVLALAAGPRPMLVLVGPRGAGKTTVGRAVAERLGRPFVDLDAEVQRVSGRTPAAWIAEEGWAAFRAMEAILLERALARPGAVLATGGGVVTEAINVARLLASQAVIVYLDASPAVTVARVELDPAPRPRLPGADDLAAEARLAQESRGPLWTRVARKRVDADAPLATVVAAVVQAWLA